jgi:hypothetical protein
VGLLVTLTVQLEDVQVPDIAAGEGLGCCTLQPEPEIEAVTLPEMPVGTMVPVIVPLMEQLLQATPENGMEKAPLLLTTVVPVESGALQLGGLAGWLPRGTSALIT